jgi:hypothetical protein
MPKQDYFIFIFILASHFLWAQADSLILGEVTFISSEHVYVRFQTTELIHIGDSLNSIANSLPCLRVEKKSSTSCVCAILQDCVISKNDKISARVPLEQPVKTKPSIPEKPIATPAVQEDEVEPQAFETLEDIEAYQERIRGRISASSYSNISGGANEDRHRMMLRFSFNAFHINNSKLSVESYFNYRQNFLPSNPDNRQTRFFRVYNLALSYDLDATTKLILGRKINRKISSVGAIDGLQIEKSFGKFYTGGIVGFRPDIQEFGFNPRLFEYGAYAGVSLNNRNYSSESTLGFLQQHASGMVDRRYAYVQHRSLIGKKFSLFGSMEIDLYGALDTIKNGDPRLTSLYVSGRYRFSRAFSLSLSYDARKQIIFYETFRSDIERLLADDEARQGLRFNLSVKPIKYINLGLSASRRYQESNANKSNNINGYISHSRLPRIGGSLSLRYNYNISNYLKSKITSVTYNRYIFDSKLNTQCYFRYVNYEYNKSELFTNQQFYGLSFGYKLPKGMNFHVLGELSASDNKKDFRINTKLIKRFGS